MFLGTLFSKGFKSTFKQIRLLQATQNEAILWKIAVLGREKPPVGAETFCPSPILAFYDFTFLHVGNLFRPSEQDLLPC